MIYSIIILAFIFTYIYNSVFLLPHIAQCTGCSHGPASTNYRQLFAEEDGEDGMVVLTNDGGALNVTVAVVDEADRVTVPTTEWTT